MVNLYKEITNKSYYDENGLIGKTLHFYNWKFFFKNYKKKVEIKDIPKCSVEDESCYLTEKLEYFWNEQLKKEKPSLLKALLQMYKWRIFFYSIFCVLGQLSLIFQAIFMGFLVHDVQNKFKQLNLNSSLIFNSFMMVFFQFLYVQFINIYYIFSVQLETKLKISLAGLIYRKSLKLNKFAFTKTSSGQIINLMTNDLNKIDYIINFLPYPFISLLIVIIGSYYLYPYLSYYVFYGIFILTLVIPFQTVMGKLFSRLRAEGAILSDERIRLMNEFVSAIRVIKMYAWENEFIKKINEARKKEINKIRSAAYKTSFNLGLFFVTSKIVIYVTLVSYVLGGNKLNAETVFIAYAILNRMSFVLTLYTPQFVQQSANTLVTFQRIQQFLLLNEVPNKKFSASNVREPQNNCFIKLKHLFCSYDFQQPKDSKKNFIEKQNKNNLVLKNINFECESKSLNIIVGPVGSGKSSILLAILNEINICSGCLNVKGKISYASQEAWTFGGSIKENILFHSPYDDKKYKKVIQVCCLEIDFTLFPQGDETIVGEKGVSLSGGQKARISLARALYCDANIYLLDDPLSAVDPHVAKHIFKEAIQKYLREKIVVLVTHQLQFLRNADFIFFIMNGEQIVYGSFETIYNELKKKKVFSEFVGKEKIKEPFKNREPIEANSIFNISENDSNQKQEPLSKKKIFTNEFKIDQFKEKINFNISFLNAFWVYFKLGLQGWLGPAMIFSFLACEYTFTFSDYFLSLWTSSEEKHNIEYIRNKNSTSFVDNLTRYQNICFYSFLMCFLFMISIIRAMLFFKTCLRSSVKLHNQFFESVVCAPVCFFDNNPIGILLNRCSRDMGIIDNTLPKRCFDFTDVFLKDISIATMIIIINPYISIPFFVLLIFVFSFRAFYLETAKYVRLYEGILKSPVLQKVSSTINGLVTVRAFGLQENFKNDFDMHQNDHSSAYYQYFLGIRFFVYIQDSIQVLFMAAILFLIILFIEFFDGSTIGLIISACLIFCSDFQWLILDLSEVEQQMLSVYHVNEYSNLPKENNLFEKNNKSWHIENLIADLSSWPKNGKIIFQNLTMKYNQNADPVLKNLSFSIESCHKIGIVGRTGAGKSSIISALFRMTDYTGSIIIDDVDTKSLTLHDLRKKISIIPQDPILFSGTIRSNLDPFDEYSDHELWKALKEANLEKTVEKMNMGLESLVSDSGSNFSVGQKQLICLARAILRKNKILILDEATANCDPQTDELIQKTIRSVFSDCTILTIAHRLNTIMDSDKILVLDAGELREYDTPINLIDKTDSLFNSMIKATGKKLKV